MFFNFLFEFFCAIADTIEESIPPDKNDPTSTSEVKLSFIERFKILSNWIIASFF